MQYGGGQSRQFPLPSRPAPSPQSAAKVHPVIRAKLQQIVQTRQLSAFYTPDAVEHIAKEVSQTVDFDALTAQWRFPSTELAYDLASLALYDIALFVDDSGSMISEEMGERVNDLELIVTKIVRFMNSNVEGNAIRTHAEASDLVRSIRYMGMTPLGTQLDAKILRPFVLTPAMHNQMPKPVLVITITDGEPIGEPRDRVQDVIFNAMRTLSQTRYGCNAVAFQFAQVGTDMGAQRAGGVRRMGIDLSPATWLVKLMVGAVDDSWDQMD
ncbi:hypothetical protein HDV00_007962 [Rhizophlyctis rosea]|nr:hypothetical protein HDV00_007962 [Rhizophlyctis rosea]